MSGDSVSVPVWTIVQNEPDGWAKAWEVRQGDKHVAWFRWRDDAEYFCSEGRG